VRIPLDITIAGFALLALAAGAQAADDASAWIEDPQNEKTLETLRTDMRVAFFRWPEGWEKALDRLEGLEDEVPFGVFETVLAEIPTGTPDARTGSFETTFTVAEDGEKTKMCVFAPEDYEPGKKWPLLIMMHGHAGTGRAMMPWYRPHAEKHGWLLCAPFAHTENASTGWGSTEPERSNPLSALEEMKRLYNVDTDRVVLAGCCMGGHGAWETGMLYADRFCALYATIGGPRIINFGYVDNLLHLPVFTYAGLEDDPLLVWNIHRAAQWINEAGGTARVKDFPELAHDVVPEEDDRFLEWVENKRRDLYPKKIVHHVNRLEHARACWLEIERFRGTPFDPYKRKQVPLKRRPKDEWELRERYVEWIRAKTPGVTAEIEDGNRIRVTARGLSRLAFYLSDRLVDLDEEVRITVNGRTRYKDVPARSVRFLVTHAASCVDPKRAFACKVSVDAR